MTTATTYTHQPTQGVTMTPPTVYVPTRGRTNFLSYGPQVGTMVVGAPCTICLGVTGCMFVLAGIINLALSATDEWGDDFFNLDVIGGVMLGIGLFMVVIAGGVAWYAKKKYDEFDAQRRERENNPQLHVQPIAAMHFPSQPSQPQPFPGQPQPFPGQPQPFPGQPQPYSGQPQPFPGQPQPYSGQPQPFPGQPQPFPSQPQPFPGKPQPFPSQPQPFPDQPPNQYPAYPGQQYGGVPGQDYPYPTKNEGHQGVGVPPTAPPPFNPENPPPFNPENTTTPNAPGNPPPYAP